MDKKNNHGFTRINTDFQIAIRFTFRVKQRFCKKTFYIRVHPFIRG